MRLGLGFNRRIVNIDVHYKPMSINKLLHCIALHCTGLDWTGLDWTGLDWIELQCSAVQCSVV